MDLGGAAQPPVKQRVFHQFADKPPGWTPESPVRYEGRPDGATIDAEGHYWVAMFEGGQLLRFAPSGEQVAALPTPVQCPTMPCFGGDDLRTLFVTSARRGRSVSELEQRPASGHVCRSGCRRRDCPCLLRGLTRATGGRIARMDPALSQITGRIRAAAADATMLRIRGGGTKDFYGEPPQGEPLSTS